MAILLLAEHDNATVSEQTAKALTAAANHTPLPPLVQLPAQKVAVPRSEGSIADVGSSATRSSTQVAQTIADSPFKGDLYIDQQDQLAWLYDRAGEALGAIIAQAEAAGDARLERLARELGLAVLDEAGLLELLK